MDEITVPGGRATRSTAPAAQTGPGGGTDWEAGSTPETFEHPRLCELPDMLTVPELARVLRIGRGKAYLLVRSGELPAIRLGSSLRIPRQAVERFIAGDS